MIPGWLRGAGLGDGEGERTKARRGGRLGVQFGGKRWGMASMTGLHRLEGASWVPGAKEGQGLGIVRDDELGCAQVVLGVVWPGRPWSGGGRRESPIWGFPRKERQVWIRRVPREATKEVDESGWGVSEGERAGMHSGGPHWDTGPGSGRTERECSGGGRDWGGREAEGTRRVERDAHH